MQKNKIKGYTSVLFLTLMLFGTIYLSNSMIASQDLSIAKSNLNKLPNAMETSTKGTLKTINTSIIDTGVNIAFNLTYNNTYLINTTTNFTLDIYINQLQGWILTRFIQIFYETNENVTCEFLNNLGAPVYVMTPYTLSISIKSAALATASNKSFVWFRFGYAINGTIFKQHVSNQTEDFIAQIIDPNVNNTQTRGVTILGLYISETTWMIILNIVVFLVIFSIVTIIITLVKKQQKKKEELAKTEKLEAEQAKDKN